MPLILPIYYTEEFKTKADKVWLVGENAFRNWHYQLKNKVKQHYHELVFAQCSSLSQVPGKFKLNIKLYYKNPTCDASNIVSKMEKFALDALQDAGIIHNDNVNYHISTTWEVAGKDTTNPRVEISIIPL